MCKIYRVGRPEWRWQSCNMGVCGQLYKGQSWVSVSMGGWLFKSDAPQLESQREVHAHSKNEALIGSNHMHPLVGLL